MLRQPWHGNVNVGTTEAASTAIDVEGYGGGSVVFSGGTTGVTVYGSVDGGTFGIAQDAGADITITVVAGKPHTFPDAIYKFSKIKLVATTGTASTNVPVFLKS